MHWQKGDADPWGGVRTTELVCKILVGVGGGGGWSGEVGVEDEKKTTA